MSKKSAFRKNDASMTGGGLPSAQAMLDGGWDTTRGIHGHARARRGLKKATNDLRRCQERDLLRKAMTEVPE